MTFMVVFIIMTVNFLLQSTLLQHIRVLNILPNTTLILVVVFSILWGKSKGAIIGLLTGLVQDILFGSMIGTNSLIYMVIGLYIGSLENSISKDNHLTPVFFTSLATISYHLLFFVITYAANKGINFLLLLKNIVLIEVIYNSVLSVFIYKIIYSYSKHPNFRLRVR